MSKRRKITPGMRALKEVKYIRKLKLKWGMAVNRRKVQAMRERIRSEKSIKNLQDAIQGKHLPDTDPITGWYIWVVADPKNPNVLIKEHILKRGRIESIGFDLLEITHKEEDEKIFKNLPSEKID